MTDEIDKIVATINAQKGELMGINAFLMAMARSPTPAELGRVLDGFDNEIAHMRSFLAYSQLPDEVIGGLEGYVKTWNAIRTRPNQS